MQEENSFALSRRNVLIGASLGAAALAAPSLAAAQTSDAGGGDNPLMQNLTGKRALVTGASRGIGAGIALALADRGADVVITYLQSTDKAADIVRIIESKGRRALAVQADSGDPAAVRRSIDETVKTLGGLDILVNNVGIAALHRLRR